MSDIFHFQSNRESVCAILQALSRCFCAVDPNTEFDSQTGIVCWTCKNVAETNERNTGEYQVGQSGFLALSALFEEVVHFVFTLYYG